MKGSRIALDWLELWFVWVLVTGIGWSVGLVIALVVAKGASLAVSSQASLLVSGVVVGALIGLTQWVVLRPEVRGVGWWVLATAIGWVAALMVTAFVAPITGPTSGGVIGGLLGGLVWGLAQWLALRSTTRGKVRWLLMTAAGWTAALALSLSLPVGGWSGVVNGQVVQVAVSGAVGSIIIGIGAVLAFPVLFPEPHERAVDRRVRWWF